MKLHFGVIIDVPGPLKSLLFKYLETIPIKYLDENWPVRRYVTVSKPLFIPVSTAQNYICIRPPSVVSSRQVRPTTQPEFRVPPPHGVTASSGSWKTQKMPPFSPIPTSVSSILAFAGPVMHSYNVLPSHSWSSQ